MTIIRNLILATTAIVSLGAAATASAQEIGTVIAFGDSLSDNGNLFAVSGTPNSPPYFAGRFSNGPVLTERLNGPMQRAGAASLGGVRIDPNANQNYAFGGARANPNANTPPDIYDQIGFFTVQDGRFAPNDVVTLYAGANDIFATLQTPGITPAGIASGSAAAARDVAGAASLLGRIGAPRVVVPNLPNLGAIPRLNSDPLASFAGTSATGVFNERLGANLEGVAAANPGSDYYYVDVRRLADAIVADPQRFGFTNVTTACLAVPSCRTAPAAQQNQFLYFDDVHPTTAGHALYSALILDYLTAADQAAAAGAMSETAFADRLRQVRSTYERGADFAAASRAGTARAGAYANVDGLVYDRDAGGGIGSYDYSSGGVTIGYETPIGERVLAGVSASFAAGSADDSRFEFDTRSFAADVYATMLFGPAHLTASAGIAHVDFDDIERRTLLPMVTNQGGNTNAALADIGLSAGYDILLGQLVVTPNASLTYAHFDVDGFTETGLAARIAYGGYDRDALYGSAGIDLSYDASLGGRMATLTGTIAYEDELLSNDDGLVSRIDGSPNRARVTGFGDLPGRGFVLGAGAKTALGDATSIAASYSVGFGDEIDQSHEGRISLGIAF
ncbi:autotransporter domain-containing protein [Fulvimarina endophytica]|uniref:Autotransporter domain-containing protein n=1 Tax=Fulvimarina endophytica TaxID=2293836 RepID=A0A371X5S4_9HYPH|nr:autotransporter domain-containing protein [Fulvimarina endophytica]RFC64384.1 autotransporter domain-containing protein [Fulvimarina endophytica]